MPLLLGVLCVFAIAYRYYSAFLAAKVAVLDDGFATPAVRLNDGQNFHPTSRWVLFGHHFAAISGAGPLIGPVLAAQFGFLPGLLWIVVGVCLAGAVQDFIALAASTRRDGKSLAQIAFTDVGKTAGTAATIAIVLILIVALAGLGKVVVKALGGETIKYPAGSTLRMPVALGKHENSEPSSDGKLHVPAGSELIYGTQQTRVEFSDAFTVRADEWSYFAFNDRRFMTFGMNGTLTCYRLNDVGRLRSDSGIETDIPPDTILAVTNEEFENLADHGKAFEWKDGVLKLPVGATLWFGENLKNSSDADGLANLVPGGNLEELVKSGLEIRLKEAATITVPFTPNPYAIVQKEGWREVKWPPSAVRLIPGSSWGVFTIACTIPIALLVGLWMYKLRPGHTVEASIIGGVLTLVATFLGGFLKDSGYAHWFDLTQIQVTWAMAIYGFVAAVLPVWVLLAPRDYLSSFLKIGTIALLVFGVLIANPKLQAPAINHAFLGGGPVLGANASIFPFLFTTIMCGAISGFHALVSSGTTSKMLLRESHARGIGYGAMLVEGLVGVVALIAAASLGPADYYAMNTDLAIAPQWQDKILQVGGAGGIEHIADYEALAQEPLRGRTGGAVTLAVGIAHVFDQAAKSFNESAAHVFEKLWPYWYHFAVMFEALFILTTIDAGTRIGRFLLQEIAGKIHPKLGRPGWWPGAIVSTAVIVAGWAWFLNSDSFAVVWKMFGIANQMLAVIALAVLSCYLVNSGKAKYLWVTLLPMAFVATTTGSAAAVLGEALISTIRQQHGLASPNKTLLFNSYVQLSAIGLMVGCAAVVVISAATRIWSTMRASDSLSRVPTGEG